LATIGAIAAAMTACAPSPSSSRAVRAAPPPLAGAPAPSVPAAERGRREHSIRLALARDDDGSPRFVLADSRGVVTENEFVRRFRDVMHTSELDGVERRRNWPAIVALSSLLAVASGVALWGALHVERSCDAEDELYAEGCDHRPSASSPPSGYEPLRHDPGWYYDTNGSTPSDAGVWALALGGVGAAAAGLGLGFALVNGDGSPFDHTLTREQTEQYVRRYNDRLPQGRHRRSGRQAAPAVRIGAGPGAIMIVGAF
jgi:hypothetical protein